MMAGDQNLSQISRGLAAVRAAEALLRTLGGCTVWVRIPVDIAAPGDPGELGLQAAATEDLALFPVVARQADAGKGGRRKLELTISAASLAQAKDIRDAENAELFFGSALGVVYSGKLWRIEETMVDEFGGVPYLYRLAVSE